MEKAVEFPTLAVRFWRLRRRGPARLLLDREQRTIQVGTPESIYGFLRSQNPMLVFPPQIEGVEVYTMEEFLDAATRDWEEETITISLEDVQARLDAQQQRLGEMVAWLDQHR
jgi:hypothetical protein